MFQLLCPLGILGGGTEWATEPAFVRGKGKKSLPLSEMKLGNPAHNSFTELSQTNLMGHQKSEQVQCPQLSHMAICM
jgi:hypothetical protein